MLPGRDAIVHCAAGSPVDRSLEAAADFARTHVTGTRTLLEAALRTGIRRLAQVSTDEVYGSIEHGAWTGCCDRIPRTPGRPPGTRASSP
ncbi:NAD-dependent epimerase/dehydratase family protein [Streptomyces sp. NPDC005151]